MHLQSALQFVVCEQQQQSITGSIPAKAGAITGWAVIGFAEQTRIWWLRGLKPGFRHCFAYRWHPQGWLLLDPLSHHLWLDLLPCQHGAAAPEAALELAAALRLGGYMALAVPIRQPPPRLAPPLPLSCVEVVKRLLGLQSWQISTPWQLFCELRKISLDDSIILAYSLFQQEQKAYMYRHKRAPWAWSAVLRRLVAGLIPRRQSMGGIFSSSAPAPLAVPPSPTADPTEAAAREARERRRRAQGETIATSYRGVELGAAAPAGLFTRKTLLGE